MNPEKLKLINAEIQNILEELSKYIQENITDYEKKPVKKIIHISHFLNTAKLNLENAIKEIDK